jgi:hypothetical protein
MTKQLRVGALGLSGPSESLAFARCDTERTSVSGWAEQPTPAEARMDAFYAAQPWLTEILATSAAAEEPRLTHWMPGKNISNLAAYGWEWSLGGMDGGSYQLLQERGSRALMLASRTPEGHWKLFAVTNAYRYGAGTAHNTKDWRSIVARWFGKRGERVVFDRIVD